MQGPARDDFLGKHDAIEACRMGHHVKDRHIKAVLEAQTCLLIALAAIQPNPTRLWTQFGALISRSIENESDPQVAKILRTLQEQYRRMAEAG